jgi:TolB-like protein
MAEISFDCRTDLDQQAVREQLARILSSGPFQQSRRRQRFLKFLVNETLAGRGERLKGYNLALEVFDRPQSFDPVIDPIVRIEAARLREKLREYYDADGRGDPIRIELPKGSYTPHIEFRQAEPPDPWPELRRDHNGEPVGRTDERPSLAVLPFVNMSATHENDYLADGFADTLITELAKVSGLFVVSRRSSFAYRDSRQPLPEISAALRVRYLIEGSVYTEKERMRVSANLIDTVSDHSLWAERYEKSIRDIFSVQDEVCRSIVRALRVRLTPSETARIGQQGTQDSRAHDELLRGLERFWRYSREACAEARHHFTRAVVLDPDYAAAHAWLARASVWQASMNWVPDAKSTLDLAVRHARRAVELDDQSHFAHSILGWVLLLDKDGENALSEARRACELDPDSADAKLFLSLVLASIGHGDEALCNIETAMLLQPHPSSFYFYALGVSRFALADYERAIAAFERGIEINPSFMPNHYELAVTYGVCGRADAALAEAAIVKADSPNISKEIFLAPQLQATWRRGMKVAGFA